MDVRRLGSLEQLRLPHRGLSGPEEARWHDIPTRALALLGTNDVDVINDKITHAHAMARAVRPQYALELFLSDPGNPEVGNIVRDTGCLDFAYRHRAPEKGPYITPIPWHEVFAAYALGKFRRGLEVAARRRSATPDGYALEWTDYHFEEARKALDVAQTLAAERARKSKEGHARHHDTDRLKLECLEFYWTEPTGSDGKVLNQSETVRRFLRAKGISPDHEDFEKRFQLLSRAISAYKNGKLDVDALRQRVESGS